MRFSLPDPRGRGFWEWSAGHWVFRESRSNGEGEKGRVKRIDNEGGEQNAGWTTFFISNLTKECNIERLWKLFQGKGRVVDVVISSKRDKNGLKFAFVRFSGIQDPSNFVKTLDGVSVNGKKIRASIPLYDRKKVPISSAKRVSPRWIEKNKGMVKEGVSYAKAVTSGTGKLEGVKENRENKVVKENEWCNRTYNSRKEDLDFLRGTFVGRLKQGVNLTALKKKLISEGFFSIKAITMGASLVLLEGEEPDDVKVLLFDAKDWIMNWFDEIDTWDQTPVAPDRETWIRCYGVPVHAWNINFFRYLVSITGVFIRTGEETEMRKRMDMARIQIKTSTMETINRVTKIKIDGTVYLIRMVEESGEDQWSKSVCEDWRGKKKVVESDYSSESEYSTSDCYMDGSLHVGDSDGDDVGEGEEGDNDDACIGNGNDTQQADRACSAGEKMQEHEETKGKRAAVETSVQRGNLGQHDNDFVAQSNAVMPSENGRSKPKKGFSEIGVETEKFNGPFANQSGEGSWTGSTEGNPLSIIPDSTNRGFLDDGKEGSKEKGTLKKQDQRTEGRLGKELGNDEQGKEMEAQGERNQIKEDTKGSNQVETDKSESEDKARKIRQGRL